MAVTTQPDDNREQASKLNELWDRLGDSVDSYYDALPKVTRDTLLKALSNWQNFYFGSDIWPTADLYRWGSVYTTAVQTLKAAIPAGAQPVAPVNLKPAAKVIELDPILITGRLPGFNVPPWWLWAIGALPALGILYLTRKRVV